MPFVKCKHIVYKCDTMNRTKFGYTEDKTPNLYAKYPSLYISGYKRLVFSNPLSVCSPNFYPIDPSIQSPRRCTQPPLPPPTAHAYHNNIPSTHAIIVTSPNSGLGPPKVVDERETSAGKLALTNPGPQFTFICCAAAIYVLATGWLRFAAAASKTAIVFCRQLSHVGWLPPGRLVFRAR